MGDYHLDLPFEANGPNRGRMQVDLSKDLRSTGPSTAGHTPHAFYRALPYLLPLVSASLALKGLLATKSQKS